MKFRSFFSRICGENRPVAILEERRDDDQSPISDESYRRIPDQFKRGGGNGGDGKGPEPPRYNAPQEPRRFAPSRLIFVVALAAAVYFAYASFSTPKSNEITWTAFNAALDSDKLESAETKGTTISGSFREIPTIGEWIELIPNGKAEFSYMIALFNKSHKDLANEIDERLTEEFNALSVRRLSPRNAENASENDRLVVVLPDSSKSDVLQLVYKDNVVLKSQNIHPTTTKEDAEAIGAEMTATYKLGRQAEERWSLVSLEKGPFSTKDAMRMVETVSRKATNKYFFKRYRCETPVFAYNDVTLDRRLREHLSAYTSTPQTDRSWWLTVGSILITIVFFVFLFKMMRSTRDSFMGGGLGVAKSLARRYDPNSDKKVTFKDVAGMDQVKAELVEVVDYLKNPAKYERMGARVPKGTLLFGPPGTGKTLLARAVAGEANVPFFSVNGSEFIQMFVGVGASRVRDLFTEAKENAPSILFIDEIDAVGRQRGAGIGGGQDEREQTLNQILSEMDGFSQNESVMVMASTNRPDVLDPALMRPGRFDRHITVGHPSMKGRVDVFKIYLAKIPVGADVDVDKLAKQTAGFTGADIRNFVNEATLWATRNDKNEVNAADFDFAFEKISLGLKREELITEENKRKTACHEAGHTVVGWFLPNGSSVHKVTIIPRGRALGVTWSLPDEDKLSYDANEATASLAHLLAGRAAEKLVYNVTTSGVENDLQRATELARDMVARWGMSERLGPVAFPSSETHPFLGREMTTESRAFSEATAQLIDEEIKRIVDKADALAWQILTEHREQFDALTDALVEEEELDRDRIREILGPAPNEPASEEATEDASNAQPPPNAANDAENSDYAFVDPIPLNLNGGSDQYPNPDGNEPGDDSRES